jgi:hypothetical protein
MKVSIDGIVGSAQRINNQRLVEDEGQKKREVRSDSVSINSRINSRLDTIETELRDIQTSLTKNQTVRDGVNQLIADQRNGGARQEQILSDVTFNSAPALREFIGGSLNADGFGEKLRQITEAINLDTGKLKRLQVEVDNITASNLAGQKTGSLMDSINGSLLKADSINPALISQLNPDSVMKLIK